MDRDDIHSEGCRYIYAITAIRLELPAPFLNRMKTATLPAVFCVGVELGPSHCGHHADSAGGNLTRGLGKLQLNHLKQSGNYICIPPVLTWSRDSVVGIATGYGLDDRRVGVRVPVG
jgi:hypothetical protein